MTMTVDPFFGPAFVDVEEVRAEPLPHTYVHGGFEGTETRFSFYFPPAADYLGRMLHVLDGGAGGYEDTAVSDRPFRWTSLAFPFSVGAYLVETNAGHIGSDLSGAQGDRTIITYRANAEAARYSKEVAARVYGTAPHHSYLFGGSGGGGRSINCMEHTHDVWDGAVPFVAGALPGFALYGHLGKALALLGPDVRKVIDASEVGGSGDPFALLDAAQASALAGLYRAGFPRGGEFLMEYPREVIGVWASWMADQLATDDPTYFSDFWEEPGYVGHDAPVTLHGLLVDCEGRIGEVLTAGQARRIESDDPMWSVTTAAMPDDMPIAATVDGVSDEIDARSLRGCSIRMDDGLGAGHDLWVVAGVGSALMVLPTGRRPMDTTAGTPAWLAGIAPGDRVTVDNRRYLAWCHHHQHQVVDGHPAYAQDTVDGIALHPQRPLLPVMMFSPFTYDFTGKMIVVQGAQDIAVWTASMVDYHAGVAARLGDAVDDRFRMWWIDRMGHLPASTYGLPARTSQMIDYLGIIEQALRDLIAWVEDGLPPPPTTGYRYTADHALALVPGAVERRGVQPIVDLEVCSVDGNKVAFRARADVPPGAGSIVAIEWDPTGTGTWVAGTDEHNHAYDRSGCYIAAVRVTSHRTGNRDDPFGRVQALGRTRVVV
jgi:hypothetical protein